MINFFFEEYLDCLIVIDLMGIYIGMDFVVGWIMFIVFLDYYYVCGDEWAGVFINGGGGYGF